MVSSNATQALRSFNVQGSKFNVVGLGISIDAVIQSDKNLDFAFASSKFQNTLNLEL